MLNPAPQGPVPLVPEVTINALKPSEVEKEQVESISPIEVVPTTSSSSNTTQDDTARPTTQTATSGTKKPNIVDKTQEKHTHHPLQNSPDSLTTLADLEEEDFIEKVEAAHESDN
jgi:hypothetical protein